MKRKTPGAEALDNTKEKHLELYSSIYHFLNSNGLKETAKCLHKEAKLKSGTAAPTVSLADIFFKSTSKKIEPPAKKAKTSNGAPVEESSDDSDSDDEKIQHSVPSKPQVKAAESSSDSDSDESSVPEKMVVASTTAKKAVPSTKKVESSDDSDSDESAPPAKPVPVAPTAAGKKPLVQATKAAESSDDSDSDSDESAPQVKKAVTVVPPKTNAIAAGKNVAKKPDSSSDSDDSDEDDAPPAKPTPAPSKNVALAPLKSSSSSEDSDDSDEEDAKPIKKMPSAPTPGPKSKTAPPKPESDDDSESDSESDEDEKPAPKVPTPAAKGKAPPAPVKDESDSDSDADEDEEENQPVVAATPSGKNASAAKQPQAPPAANGKELKIYVKGLPWAASESEVRDFFKACGKPVSVELPIAEDGRSTGTAFVKFSSRAQLDAALALDGQLWPGTERWLKIQEGIDKPERKSFGESNGVRPEGCDTVFVGNLSWDVDEDSIREVFQSAGEISSVRLAVGEDGNFRGFGHVSFYTAEDTEKAVKLAGTDVKGRAIRVDFAPPKKRESFGSPGGGRGRGGGREGGRGRGGRDGGRGRGRGGSAPSLSVSKSKGTIAAGSASGTKKVFD